MTAWKLEKLETPRLDDPAHSGIPEGLLVPACGLGVRLLDAPLSFHMVTRHHKVFMAHLKTVLELKIRRASDLLVLQSYLFTMGKSGGAIKTINEGLRARMINETLNGI